MYDFKVVIDPGHGGDDPGAVANNTNEKDLTKLISDYMYERFKEMGVPVAITRTTDETVNPTERVNRILNAFGNSEDVIVISNHINSSSSSSAQGAEVIYALRNDDTLAENILNALESAGQVTRTFYQRRLPSDTSKDYYFIHRNTGKTEPVLIEYGFINNTDDLNRIKTNYKKYVDAIVDAVIATKMGGSIPPQGTITYVVKKGDSLYKIANEYNTTVAELKRLNNLTSDLLTIVQILLIPSDSTSGTESQTYVVKIGDTLYSIAKKFNTTVDNLKKLNNLQSDTLSVGQVLTISGTTNENVPSTVNYTVAKGDSLWSIARKYNITVDELKKANNLTSDLLSIGQVLKIPVQNELPPENSENLTVYVVKSGDNLYKIANEYNTTVAELKRLNGLSSDLLSVGQVLRVPNNSSTTFEYIVKSGDTLYRIAQYYNTTVDEIKKINNLTTNSLIIGQVLQIPKN